MGFGLTSRSLCRSTFPVNEATYFFPYAGQTVTVDGNGPSSAAESTATRGSDNKNLFISLASVMQYSCVLPLLDSAEALRLMFRAL